MKHIKLLCYLLAVTLFGCVKTTNQAHNFLPISLPDKIAKLYHSGEAIILYAHREDVLSSEAYADWSSYFNDFKKVEGLDYVYRRVDYNEFNSVVEGATEFTLFLKKGCPTYLYEGLIVEPQVYVAIHHKFSEQPLTDVDKAFMPTVINRLIVNKLMLDNHL